MVKRIASLPAWLVFSLLIAAMFAGSFIPTPLGTFVSFMVFAAWLFALSDGSNRLLSPGLQRSTGKLQLALLYAACYTLIGGMYLVQHQGINAIQVPFHLLAMFCIFYAMYFAATSMRSYELNKDAAFADSWGIFFGLWFFPIGVWFVQPRINRIVGSHTGYVAMQ